MFIVRTGKFLYFTVKSYVRWDNVGLEYIFIYRYILYIFNESTSFFYVLMYGFDWKIDIKVICDSNNFVDNVSYLSTNNN
jgi:hypothetical protein